MTDRAETRRKRVAAEIKKGRSKGMKPDYSREANTASKKDFDESTKAYNKRMAAHEAYMKAADKASRKK